MGVPQVIVICLMAISVGININETTNDRKSMSSFVTSLIGNILWATLLWWGGFWK